MHADTLTIDEANAVYDILATHVGLSETGRDEFVYRQTHHECREHRIGGVLGLGGKFRRGTDWRADGTLGLRWFLTAYEEDTTPEVQTIMDAANPALDALRAMRTGT